jgi:hypothetical protein
MTVPVKKADTFRVRLFSWPAAPPFRPGQTKTEPPCTTLGEFTGVRYAKTPHVTPRVRRKTLTSFRESETPLRPAPDFSRAFPPFRLCPVRWHLRVEVPFFRHFSVTHGGIKTYLPDLRKKLFARPGRPILPAFLRSLSPQFTGRTQDLVFDSDLMSISC